MKCFLKLGLVGTASKMILSEGRFFVQDERREDLFAHRFFAEEEVVDDEEEVFPRGHDHPAALLQQLAAPPTHALLSRLHPDPTSRAGAAAGDRSMEPGCAAAAQRWSFLQESNSPAVQAGPISTI